MAMQRISNTSYNVLPVRETRNLSAYCIDPTTQTKIIDYFVYVLVDCTSHWMRKDLNVHMLTDHRRLLRKSVILNNMLRQRNS